MIRKCISAVVAAFFALCVRAAEFAIDCATGTADVPASIAVGDSVAVRLADGEPFALVIVAAPPAGIAGQSFVARDERRGASAVVKPTANGIRISIDDFERGRAYTVLVKDGVVSTTAIDTAMAGCDECGACCGEVAAPQVVPYETAAPKSAIKPVRVLSADDFEFVEHKSVVDILVAFDQGAVAKSAALGYDTIEDFADYAVGKMNTVLANSQLDDVFCYRLAGVVEIDGRWTKVDGAVLGALRAREGPFAKLSLLRDKCGADTITLLVDRTEGSTTGIAYTYSSSFAVPSTFDSMNYACNVCDIKTVHSRYTMSHETGHNMGCGHSNRQGSSSGPGRYPDGCGYHFVDANNVRRYTIMAYSYTADDNYTYSPVPYFSTPDISPAEYGCALGVEGTNNNRRTLSLTHADTASLREHVIPYEWDVRFLDGSGNDIPDGAYFFGSVNVTLTNSNPNAIIYYTLDGTNPDASSLHCGSWTNVYVYLVNGAKTLTACAVVDGKAQSVRSITLHDGLAWSGDSNGNGLWTSSDSSVRPWSGEYFYNGDPVQFPDLAGVSSATVTVNGVVSPGLASFPACKTAYCFAKGNDAAQIEISNACFAPQGDVTFNVPVQLSATAFTNMTGCALTFNAPFGQTVDSSGGSYSGMVNIGPSGTLTVEPGAGKTQTLERLNNVGWYAGTSTFRVGEGKVVFNGAINGGAGVIGRTKLAVGDGGELVFDVGGGTGYDMNQTSLTVEKGGAVTFNQMEHLRRALNLEGGTIRCKTRLDLMGNPGVRVTDDSSVANAGGGYVLIRNSDSEIEVAEGKTLSLGVGTQTDNRSDTAGWGIVKRGGGTLAANVELKHSGCVDIAAGTVAVGYSSGGVYGYGWMVGEGAKLKVNAGCSLRIPGLTLGEGAAISVPAAASAPITVTNDVSVAGAFFELEGATGLSAGDAYPLIRSEKSTSGVEDAKANRLPSLAKGLKWELETDGGVLWARVVEKSDMEDAVRFTSNVDSLFLLAPDDAEPAEGGGAVVAGKPFSVDGFSMKAVSVAVRFVVPEQSPSGVAAICSWKLGEYIINCERAADGTLGCSWCGDSTALQYVANTVGPVALTPGEHLLQIGYFSNTNDSEGGTRVLLDGVVAYEASGLRFSNDSVSRVTFGATAETVPRYPYAGLVLREVAVLDAHSSGRAVAASMGVFAVPGSGVRFIPDFDAVSQMDGYVEGETNVQEFLEGNGGNGQPRWVSYVLGIDADNDTAVRADIKVEGGKVVITPAKDARDIPGLVIESKLYGSGELSSAMPFIKTVRGDTIEVEPFENSASGFYRLEVSVDAQ